MTTPEQQAAYEQAVVRVAFYLSLDFKDGAKRFSTLPRHVEWGGFTWIGTGSFAGFSPIAESESGAAKGQSFRLSGIDVNLLSAALVDPGLYRGRAATLYRAPHDEAWQPIGTPEVAWRGRIQKMGVEVTDSREGSISLQCETAAYGLKKASMFRACSQQQKTRHPTDTGFDRVAQLIARPQIWATRAFQIWYGRNR